MSSAWGQRQSCASGECRPPSAAPLPFPMSARRDALGNPLGGYPRANHPSTLDKTLAQSIGGGGPPHGEAGKTVRSSSTSTSCSSPSALELERTAGPQCLVGSSTRAPAPLRGGASPDFSVEAQRGNGGVARRTNTAHHPWLQPLQCF